VVRSLRRESAVFFGSLVVFVFLVITGVVCAALGGAGLLGIPIVIFYTLMFLLMWNSRFDANVLVAILIVGGLILAVAVGLPVGLVALREVDEEASITALTTVALVVCLAPIGMFGVMAVMAGVLP